MTDEVSQSLRGKVVLAVEDEAVIAIQLQQILEDLGCTVLGPALNLVSAAALADRDGIEAAVMDINVGGETAYGLAEQLTARGIPVVLASGYGRQGIRAGWESTPMITKPYTGESMAQALLSAIQVPNG